MGLGIFADGLGAMLQELGLWDMGERLRAGGEGEDGVAGVEWEWGGGACEADFGCGEGFADGVP